MLLHVTGQRPMRDKFSVKNEIMSNQQLAEKLHEPIIRKFDKQQVLLYLKDNIWGADLSDMQLISKLNKMILSFVMCH